jgi:hypothetical protein
MPRVDGMPTVDVMPAVDVMPRPGERPFRRLTD